MPVFHTKTIQSILDPVAQQVSFVSLHSVLWWHPCDFILLQPVTNTCKPEPRAFTIYSILTEAVMLATAVAL